MREIVAVGTMHNMFPKFKDEFVSILEDIDPDQVLIEIDEKDVGTEEFDTYPEEMVFAYEWARFKEKEVGFFDADMELLRDGVSQEDEDRIEREWDRKYENYDWKFFNKDTSSGRLNVWTIEKIIDLDKMRFRQEKMLENIKKLVLDEGRVLILMGAYHLDFFDGKIDGARFLFR